MNKRTFNKMVNYALFGYSLGAFIRNVLKGEKVEGIDKYWQYANEVANDIIRG